MSLLDTIKDTVNKYIPQKDDPLPKSGGGALLHEDDMIVSKPAIVFHAAETFFSFLALCCFASVAAFQAKWGVGPSGLSGFSIFVALFGMFLALFMLLVPVIYEKYDKLMRLARAIKEVRVVFILAGSGLTLTFLISFITTISAWTEPGCKDPNKDPNASKGDGFKNGLSDWCTTKKAGAIFFWLSTIFWIATMVLCFQDWRSGKSSPRRDPHFNPPPEMHAHEDDEFDDEEEINYGHVSSSAAPQLPPLRSGTDPVSSPFGDEHQSRPESEARGRTSIDAYGAFSDPAPSGFGGPPSPGVSRTMQYADPYAAVRANIVSAPAAAAQPGPPSYEYQGYR